MLGMRKKDLQIRTLKINKKIYSEGYSILNFGNASILDQKRETFFIKASGSDIETCVLKNMVEVNLKKFRSDKKKQIKPSVDTIIHLELYKYLKNVNCTIHTHSEYSTIISQSNIEPECFGTTHADYFYGKIPISDKIRIVDKKNYEFQVAQSITKKLKRLKNYCPGILLRDHGLFTWGKTEKDAFNNLVAIEYICKLYFKTKYLIKKPKISKSLSNFHFSRKHGKNKYYGQT